MFNITVPRHMHNDGFFRVNHWFYEEGDEVMEHDPLVEVSTNEGSFEIVASHAGILEEVFIHVGDSFQADDLLGVVCGAEDSYERDTDDVLSDEELLEESETENV